MPVEVLAELGERLPDVRLFNFYGQTEMSPVATVLGPEDQVRKAGSAGRPALNVETTVVDEDGTPVPAGEVGEIVHRSPQAMLGYWDDPAKTAETFRGGWLHTGDLGDPRRRGLPLRRRPQEGHDQVGRRERRLARGRGGHPRAPGRGRGRRVRIPHPRWIEAVAAAVVPRAGTSRAPRRSPRSAASASPASRPRGTSSSPTGCPRTRAARSSSASCGGRRGRRVAERHPHPPVRRVRPGAAQRAVEAVMPGRARAELCPLSWCLSPPLGRRNPPL